MDQFEFENYIEKMKHRIQEGDYKTAARIADKIQWEYVQDINLLVFAANIYENIKDYDSAKVILEYAYSIAPVKNRLYYALCSINIKAKDFKEAGNYYFDFCQSFPDDPRKQILKYYYLTARHADLEQRIRILEEYTEEEKDEEMLYELALLYEKIDNQEKMIETCDFIVDFFGVKKNGYGKDALLLKKKHTVLSDTEEGLLQDYRFNIAEATDDGDNFEMGSNDRFVDITKIRNRTQNQESQQDNTEEQDNHRVLTEDKKKTPVVLKVGREGNIDDEIIEEQPNTNTEPSTNFSFTPDKDSYDKNELENVFLKDAEQKEKLKKMIATFKEEEKQEAYLSAFNEYKNNAFILKGRFDNMRIEDIKLHMIIEANNKEEGVEIAKSELDYIHKVLNENIKVAKVSSYNVNDKGFSYYLQKLGNRDLIIESAGRLRDQVIDEIEEFIISKKHHNIITLVDVLNNFDKLAKERPSFVERFDIYSVLSEKEQASLDNINKEEDVKPKEIANVEYKRETLTDHADRTKQMEDFFKRDNEEQENNRTQDTNIHKESKEEGIKVETNDELMRRVIESKRNQNKEEETKPRDKEMSVEEFVEFCKRYTKSIDCVMQGKTIPALYEKVEDLIEDGVRLTETNAIKLIEEAADKAEKPKLFNKPKYDKDGCLILTEDHFI